MLGLIRSESVHKSQGNYGNDHGIRKRYGYMMMMMKMQKMRRKLNNKGIRNG